jgi:hypothetical protein
LNHETSKLKGRCLDHYHFQERPLDGPILARRFTLAGFSLPAPYVALRASRRESCLFVIKPRLGSSLVLNVPSLLSVTLRQHPQAL